MKNKILKDAAAISEKIIAHRRHIHALAEVGFDLPRTKEYVKNTLLSLGCSPRELGRCGLICDIGEGEDYILLRADMDALPITEKSGVDFAAANGNMHACGHDMHAAMLLGCAEILRLNEKKLRTRVRLMFQGAEELLAGARDMLESGLFDGGAPRLALMLHIISSSEVKNGVFLIPSGGTVAPSADFFKIEICGMASHGAAPFEGINAASAAASIVLAIEGAVAASASLGGGSIASVGRIFSGETANTVPELAVVEGSVRAFSRDEGAKLIGKITLAAEHAAMARGATAKLTVTASAPPLINDKASAERAFRLSRELFGDEAQSVPEGMRGGGSEDFAYISEAAPSVMIALSAGKKGALHSPYAVFDEGVLHRGSALLSYIAMRGLDTR